MFDRMIFMVDSSWFDLPSGVIKVCALIANNMDGEPITIQDIARAWSVDKAVAMKWIGEGIALRVVSQNEYGELSAHAYINPT